MSANFYDNSGMMAGIDLHKYWALPPPPLGHTEPVWPYAAATAFLAPSPKVYLRTASVTADKQEMIAGGFDNGPTFHMFIPFPLPPHAAEVGVLAMVFTTSTSTAQLTIGSVTGEGNALATCIAGGWGLNVNCCDPLDMPVGNVVVLSTVKTSPTLGDFVAAIVGWIVNATIGYGVGKGLDKVKKLKNLVTAIVKNALRVIQDLLKKLFPNQAWIIDPSTTLGDKMRRLSNWEFESMKRLLHLPANWPEKT